MADGVLREVQRGVAIREPEYNSLPPTIASATTIFPPCGIALLNRIKIDGGVPQQNLALGNGIFLSERRRGGPGALLQKMDRTARD